MSEYGLSVPTSRGLIRLGVSIHEELHAGKQSRVFAATVDGRQAALKLTNRRLADGSVLAERMLAAEAAAAATDVVVAPMRIAGALVQPVGECLVTATAFVAGVPVDVTDGADAAMLGHSLAGLHDALARLPPFALPPVAALEGTDDHVGRSGWQLLHGDYSDQNTIVTEAGLRVFDFDDCGYGPVAYDLANTLYMVMFDSEVTGRPERYGAFRPAFLDGYASTAGSAVDHSTVDSLIGTRIGALGRWLDDLANAPIGIRTSSREWRDTLRAFVVSHDAAGSADA